MNNEWKDLPTLPGVGAAQLEGWEIEVLMLPSIMPVWSAWQGRTWTSNWKFHGRPRQPKMKKVKKVKSLCWRYPDGDFAWRIEGIVLSAPWIRVPSEDKTVEVPE